MRVTLTVAVAMLLAVNWSSTALSQNPGGGNQGGAGGGQFPGGIAIDASGVVERAMVVPGGAALQRQLQQASQRSLSAELNRPSAARRISLKELDAELARRLAAGTELTADIRCLAGLTRIDFIFITADGQDVLLVGPAEGFAQLPGGRFVGVESGRPVLCLDDLLVALRSAAAQDMVGCSIDPHAERLSRSLQWLQQNSAPATVDVVRARLEHMVSLQGHWNVRTFGLPEGCRMSLAMVEADYVMKRLAIGLDNPGVRGLKSSLALAKPGDNMLRRWWFAPHYDPLERNAAGTAFHLAGPRLQLFAQEELLDAEGRLVDAAFSQASSERFASLFNERVDELARRIPAFADLQNMFDVLVTAAVVRECQRTGRLQWGPDVLAQESQLATATYTVPRETKPMLNARSAGAALVIAAYSGGVTFQPGRILRQVQEATDAEQLRQLQVPEKSPAATSSWWWD